MDLTTPVSVVIPAYNAAATIRAQLEALDRQVGAPPFEVVVVDNASTDDTARVVEGYHPANYELRLLHEARQGSNHARNTGIAAAQRDAIFLCDADDEVHPDWLASLAAALEPGTWVAGELEYEKLNSEVTRRAWVVENRPPPSERDALRDPGAGCNLGFERKLWEEIGGFDTSLSGTGGDETEFLLRAHAAGYRITRVPEAIVHYRLRPGLRSAIRQRYRQGRAQMLMRLKPGGQVFFATPPTVRTVLVTLLRLLAVLPRHLGSDLRRHQWLGATALQVGRLVGLWRYRARPPASSE